MSNTGDLKKESFQFYSLERQKKDKESFWVYWVTRKISFWITPILIRAGVSANQATVFGILVGIIAAGFIITGAFWYVFFGAILMQFWLIMDSVDGNIARIRKKPSLLGKFLEELNGEIMSALFFTSIGIAASRMPGFFPFPFNINPSPYLFIVLGALASFSIIFRHLISVHYLAIFSSDKEFKAELFLNSRVTRFFYNLVIKFLGIYSSAQPLLLLAAVFNALGLYTIIYSLMHIGAMFANIAVAIFKAKEH